MNILEIIKTLDSKVKEVRKAHDDDWDLEYFLEWVEELIEKLMKDVKCIDCIQFDECHNEFEWERYRDNKADIGCFEPQPEEYYK